MRLGLSMKEKSLERFGEVGIVDPTNGFEVSCLQSIDAQNLRIEFAGSSCLVGHIKKFFEHASTKLQA